MVRPAWPRITDPKFKASTEEGVIAKPRLIAFIAVS
jgi:hypothetical protein